MCKQVYLVGIGPGNEKWMTIEGRKILRQCDAIIGADRMVEQALCMLNESERTSKERLKSYKAEEIRAWLEAQENIQKAAIVLSGDTGFYSGARKLKEALAEYEVIVLPGISSIVYLAGKLEVSWEDAKLASIHGRAQNYIQMIARNEKTFLLFGGSGSEEAFCKKIKEYAWTELTFWIGRNLSYPEEEIIVRNLEELCPEDLEGLCTILVLNKTPDLRIGRSIPDEEWIRGNVPMTKEEVRTISIAKLQLFEHAVVYDIGAGTGSIAVEAAGKSDSIRVYAIEQKEEGIRLIEKNKRKFKADWVTPIHGKAPEVLEKLEPPTHVFIGGSSGNLKEILACVKEKNPEVRIVLNAISLETMKEVLEAQECGLLKNPEIVQVSISKARTLGAYHMMTGSNPIYIISDGQ